ncbi:MAG: hypothetical protein R6U42_09270 [Halomonas sp.]
MEIRGEVMVPFKGLRWQAAGDADPQIMHRAMHVAKAPFEDAVPVERGRARVRSGADVVQVAAQEGKARSGDAVEQERVLMQALSTLFTHPLPDPVEPVVEECMKGCRQLIRELYQLQKRKPRRSGSV